jgi:hypothetical protein
MSSPGFLTTRRLILIAVVAACALVFCQAPVGIRATGIYAYACLTCGQVGAIASDRTARWLIYVPHAPDWLVYVASYSVFLIVNAVLFFAVLWVASAIIRLVARLVARQRSSLGRS